MAAFLRVLFGECFPHMFPHEANPEIQYNGPVSQSSPTSSSVELNNFSSIASKLEVVNEIGARLSLDKYKDLEHEYYQVDGNFLALNIGTPEPMLFRPQGGKWTFAKYNDSYILVTHKGETVSTFYVDTKHHTEDGFFEIHPYIPTPVADGKAAIKAHLSDSSLSLIWGADNNHGTAYISVPGGQLASQKFTIETFREIQINNIPLYLSWRYPHDNEFFTSCTDGFDHADSLDLILETNEVYLFCRNTFTTCFNCSFSSDGSLDSIYLNGYAADNIYDPQSIIISNSSSYLKRPKSE